MTKNTSSTNVPTTSGRTIQSVQRAAAIVEQLAAAREGLTLSELARTLHLAPQTLGSLLRTLQSLGWAVQAGPRGRYSMGPGVGEIYRTWRAGQDRVGLARPVVTGLCARTREYVILAEWAGDGLIPLLEAHPDRELLVRGESFRRDRLHAMATGKLLLSLLSESQRREIVAALPLPPHGPKTVTDPAALLRELESISRTGEAVCIEEACEGVAAVAVSVPVSAADRPAAIGVSLPLARFSASRGDELIAELGRAAEAVAKAWG